MEVRLGPPRHDPKRAPGQRRYTPLVRAAPTRPVWSPFQDRRLPLTLLLLTLLGCRAPEPTPPEQEPDAPRRVLLVVLDAARPDRFSCYGYGRETTPNLDALASRGVICRQHRTHETATRRSVPALLWSRYFAPPLLPVSAQIPLADTTDLALGPGQDAMSLPALLAADGFRTAAISAHPWICSGNEGLQDFEEVITVWPEPGGASLAYATAGPVVDAAIAWFEEHPDEHAFVYLHLMDPHFPHVLGPEARAFLGDGDVTPLPDPLDERTVRQLGRTLTEEERAQLDALADGSLAHADHHLGRLFDGLGVPRDRALIVVTADHGEHLLEVPDRFGHDGPWYEAVARVPLIVHYPPALPPGEVESPSGAVDIVPTMTDLLGVSLPPGVRLDGRNVVAPAEEPPADLAVAAGGIVQGTDKCLFFDPPERVLDPTLPAVKLTGERYDLATDPLEQRDLWDTDPAAVERCVDAYQQWLGDAHQRYRESRRSTPLRLPFALGIGALGLEPAPPAVTTDADQPLAAVLTGGWQRIVCDRRTLLGSGGGETIVTLRLDIPEGRYRLSLGALGAARVTVGNGEPVPLELRPVSPDRPVPGHFAEANLGVVQVPEGGLEIHLAADPAGQPFLLRHVELAPTLDGAGPAATIPAGMDEQLRALGYVE